MIVAHLSDLHLGFRAYGRMERGVDVRERDVAVAWERAVQELVRLAPQVVVVAGDVFDRPDPPAGALVTLARSLELLRSSLPETIVLMVAGPRDTPRRPGDPGALAVLDTFPNVQATADLHRSVLLDRLDMHASLVPYRVVVRDPAFIAEPHLRARWNLLVLHAREGRAGSTGVFVDPADWDYVALGGEHRRRKVADRIQYSGSLERVALDPWDEATDEKGFLVFDLELGQAEFHAIPGRPVVALAPIKVAPEAPDRLRRRVDEVTREVPGGINGKIVRLRLEGVDPQHLLYLQGEQLHSLRERALHLAVEAGREPRVPTESWLPSEAPRFLRDALVAELARDGLADPPTRELVGVLVPDPSAPPAVPGPVGVLEAVDGLIPGLGRVSTSISPGLTAIIGGGGRSRRAVAGLLADVAGVGEGPVARLWAGWGGETLDGALHQALEAVAEGRGMSVVTAALERARDMGAPEPPPTANGRATTNGAVRVDVELVAAEFRAAEREMRALRADVAEVDGDLEVATMDWHRERQDAETTLNAYRDRARELRARIRQMEAAGPTAPCPTCGRVLESHYDEVLTELRDEWEAIVQDGSWWRRRTEQLEPKPAHLQEREQRSLRLHAALEATSERVELLRARLDELAGSPTPRRAASLEGSLGSVTSALLRIREARLVRAREVLLARASRYVGRISGGRILAVTWADDVALLQGDAGPLTPLSEEDLAAGRVALRLAGASLVGGGGPALASLVVEEPFDRLDPEAALRTLVLLRTLLREIPRIIVITRGDAVDARPELFDAVLELRDNVEGRPAALRPVPAGAGRVVFRAPALAPRHARATFRGRPSS